MPGPQVATGCPVAHLEAEYDPFRSPQLEDPHPVWQHARDTHPVFHSVALDAWVITRYADAMEVLRDPVAFPQGYGSRKLFAEPCPEADAILAGLPSVEETNTVSTDPPLHSQLRRHLQPALTPRHVRPYEADWRALAHALIDRFEDNGRGDFYQDFAHAFPLHVIGGLIGLPEERHHDVVTWANQRILLRFGNPTPETQVEAALGQRDAVDFTLDMVRDRRARPGEDLISRMVRDSDASDAPLSDEQLAAQVTDLLSAGHETSAYFLTMMMHRVLPDRSLWAALPGNPGLVAAVVEEALRTDGPAQAIWRTTSREVTIAGVNIPAGARLSVVLSSANADDSFFDAPETFRLGRANATQHVAFGRGIHTCVGSNVGRAESRIALDVLATRLPSLRLAEDDGYRFRPGAVMRMASALNVEWDPPERA